MKSRFDADPLVHRRDRRVGSFDRPIRNELDEDRLVLPLDRARDGDIDGDLDALSVVLQHLGRLEPDVIPVAKPVIVRVDLGGCRFGNTNHELDRPRGVIALVDLARDLDIGDETADRQCQISPAP